MANWVVIGSNRGIGLEMTLQAAARGEDVVAVSRSSSTELEEASVTTVTGIDITSDGDVAKLAERLAGKPIDVLVVVAGVLDHVTLDNLDFELIRRDFEVNAVGPLRVVGALQHLLADGAKVGLLTSRMGSIADNTSGGSYAYRMSKAALNMAGKSLAVDLAPRNISVTLLHPGFVRTDMTGGNGFIDADESAKGLLARLDELGPDSTGTFWHTSGEELPW